MNITFKDLILETLPFREEILYWCKTHQEFKNNLKALVSRRFLPLGVITISYPSGTNDEVIGIYAYDYKNNPPLFKQDFIVDVGMTHKEFVLYTGFPKGTQSTKDVKHIKEFFIKYGQDGNYADSHHLTFEQLPEDKELRRRAMRIIEIASHRHHDISAPPKKVLIDTLRQIREIKKNKWMELRKSPKDKI